MNNLEGNVIRSAVFIKTAKIEGDSGSATTLYIRKACINDVNFTKSSKDSHPYGKTNSEYLLILRVFGREIPKHGPINVKFGKFHDNPSNELIL